MCSMDWTWLEAVTSSPADERVSDINFHVKLTEICYGDRGMNINITQPNFLNK